MTDLSAHRLNLPVILVLHLVLTALPGVAAALMAVPRGVREEAIVIGAGLAGSGLSAMVGFWIYFLTPRAGLAYGYVLPLVSAAVVLWSWSQLRQNPLRKQLITPLALWALGSTFLVCLGFMYGGTTAPIATGSTRFSYQLPADNYLPLYFADWFSVHGHDGVAPEYVGGWLASDRPPLQIAYVLTQRALDWQEGQLDYQVLSVILQQLWIVAVWALLAAVRADRMTRTLIMVALLASDLTIVNGFFVWPKMLAAVFLVAAVALVATPLWPDVRRSPAGGVLVAALVALSMLSHAASLFGVLPLMAIGLRPGVPRLRWLTTGVLTGMLFMLPWSAYQRFADPPGNRLMKWMLGGFSGIDARGALPTIIAGYREVGGGALTNKLENFSTMVGVTGVPFWGGGAIAAFRGGDVIRGIFDLRTVAFFHVAPQFGLLLFGPVAMAIAFKRGRRHAAEWRLARMCLTLFALGLLAWGLLMFGSEDTRAVVHTGSYGVIILGLAGAVAGLRCTFPRLAIAIIVTRLAVTLVLYVPGFTATPDLTPYADFSAVRVSLAVVSLAGFCLVATGWPTRSSAHHADSRQVDRLFISS